ncbi:PfkB family carbohydrate kinase [Microvirga sp. KLBC 81]|uniref:PfkB family carbohydrate kinase n=1 Tax=Microvirga sp. KLBC 81 TaxID=1862707 RepID=UPI001403AE63
MSAFGISVSQDISTNSDAHHLGIEGLDVAFASAEEDLDHAEQLLNTLLSRGTNLAVVTCGSRGSMDSDDTRIRRTGIKPVEVVDTIGAGDSSIAWYSSGQDLQRPWKWDEI